jgi:ABC-type phosphate/phosphonate transport system substrate-binding protein
MPKIWLCTSAIGAVLATILIGAARAESRIDSAATINARIGYLTTMFHDIDVTDAEIAIEIWMEELMNDIGHDVRTNAIFFDDVGSLVVAIQKRQVDVVALSALGFIDIADQVRLEPRFVGVDGDRFTEEYILLVRRERDVSSLQKLRGTDLVVTKGSETHSIALMWLDLLLNQNGLARKESFFANIREVNTTSKAVLPVFFDQAASCLVSARMYDTIVELNPQIGRELQVYAVSPELLIGLICLHPEAETALKDAFESGVRAVGEYAKGRQILTLFKLDKTAEYQPTYLDSSRAIVERHRKLIGSTLLP